MKSELAKMQAFIKKEAQEKSKEIRLKADEEYEIEKASIVRAETAAIDAAYEQKLKKASLAQQITRSKIDNKTRLRVLATKEEVLSEIFDETEQELRKLTKDKSKYKSVMALLIEEALLNILEEKVILKVKKDDLDVAKEAIDIAKTKFSEKSKFDVEITISDDYLSKDSIGGVVLSNGAGNIDTDNTLDERLKLLSENSLPIIRLELFGISKTRKFFD